jgi:membrane-associated PAP2 superfamily phosphatase
MAPFFMPRQQIPRTLAPSRLFLWSACSLLLLLLWDFSGLDLQLAQWFGSARGFPLESHWLWRGVLHDGIRYLPWLLELALLLAMFWPFGAIKQLPVERRAQLALSTLVALLVVSSIKLHSSTSCPWDLQQFGGAARYLSHWAWGVADGGGGGCFPAGHASAGFAFVSGFFAFRHALPATARRWLVGALAVGLLLGLAQQVRGAHFMSHTLWTAWFCWMSAALVDLGVSQLLSQKPARALAPVPVLAKLRPSLQAK